MRRLTSEDPAELPIEYFMSASEESLRNFETLQLNHAANLEKEIVVMMRERDRSKVRAEFARLLIEMRPEIVRRAGKYLERVTGEHRKVLPETA